MIEIKRSHFLKIIATSSVCARSDLLLCVLPEILLPGDSSDKNIQCCLDRKEYAFCEMLICGNLFYDRLLILSK